MRRDDLFKGNDGWQVLDPTPQELSDGTFLNILIFTSRSSTYLSVHVLQDISHYPPWQLKHERPTCWLLSVITAVFLSVSYHCDILLFKAGWCFLSAWQSNWQNECLLFRWVLLWSVSSDGHQGGKSGSKVRRYLCIRWGERRHHLLDRPRRWPTEEGDWLLFWLTSYLLKLKSSNDHNDYSYCYSSKRTRELWGGTSAPKVFMATSEKMSLCTTNILKVRWQGLHRGVELELQTFIAAILINLYWL